MAGSAVILIMIDGLGIGEANEANPLTAFSPRILRFWRGGLGPLPGRGMVFETRVDGGVRGRPQSATNHTALLTGINTPAILGRHLSGFPNRTLRELLARHSIHRQLLDLGLWPTFANCFRPAFFVRRPRWVSASTVMVESAGMRLRTLTDLEAGRGIYMDITNAILAEAGLAVAPVSPAQAAGRLLALAERFDFIFYEYFLTDVAGHRGSLPEAVSILTTLDAFLSALVESLPDGASLVVTSDHGNLEDLHQRQHTENPVATLVWGPLLNFFGRETLSLSELTPRIVRFLSSR